MEALQRQLGMTQTALSQAFVWHARVVTSLSQECDIETQSCPLHLTIKIPWAPFRFTMPFIVLPGGGDVVIFGPKTLIENLGIEVMAQLKDVVLKAQGCQDGAGMELTARSVGKSNDGAVLRAAMAVTAFVPGGNVPGDVDDVVTLTLPSTTHDIPVFRGGNVVEMRDRAGVLETAVDSAVDHDSSPECAKVLRDIVLRTHLDVLRRALSGDSRTRKRPGAVRFHSGARLVRVRPPPERNRLCWSAAESCSDCCSVLTTGLLPTWPEKGRRWRAPGGRCRTCLMARRPSCEKSSRRCD